MVVLCAGILGYSYATTSAGGAVSTYQQQADLPDDERTSVAEPRENVTVIAGHGQNGESAALVAFAPSGEVLYYDDSFHGYFDVDPVEGESRTVEYVAERNYAGDDCDGPCTISAVERVNLTTGEVTPIYSQVIPQDRGANWHDVDRLDDSRLLVGDIFRDEVYVVNTTTGLTEWEWTAKTDFPLSGGGTYPADWAHLNDVERLPDGRYMFSLRNQDQVVFVDPETGLQSDWTLGAEDEYGVLYEQHNPDYVPESHGGPSAIVADSLNDRIVEYQRVNGSDGDGGEWKQSWVWSDDEMKWPRDADRLPNGNTLIADTNAHRVVEVNESGDVVWRANTYAPYDVERLGTGDESAGGRSAESADLRSRGPNDSEELNDTATVAGYTPRKVTNSLAFVLPLWMSYADAAVAVLLAVSLLTWAVVEYRNASVSVSFRWPVRFE